MITNITPLENSAIKKGRISIMIPFAANGDRGRIFMAVVRHLSALIKGHDIELCVHESSPCRHLTDDFIKEHNLKYVFTRWTEVFHKSWNLNVIAKYVATGDYFVIYDGDLLVDNAWLKQLKEKASEYYCGYGWTSIKYLCDGETSKFIEYGKYPVNPSLVNIVYPNNQFAAGGINIISREDYFELKGWPEDFRGSWGGADNGFAAKTRTFGMQRSQHIFSDELYHLNHEHRTYKQDTRFTISDMLDRFNKDEWRMHMENLVWGDINLEPVCEAQRINVTGDMNIESN